jgi:hypothetical protein
MEPEEEPGGLPTPGPAPAPAPAGEEDERGEGESSLALSPPQSAQERSAAVCQEGAQLLFNAACSADFRAAAAKFDESLRITENAQARRFLSLASELDLESRVTNFFIEHQHDCDVERLGEAAAQLASEQVAIGERALESAEDTRHLVVAVEYFKAALRLAPAHERAAVALEAASARLFSAREKLPMVAPPYRPGDAVRLYGVKVLRGLQQSEGGALFVVYEVSCTHGPDEEEMQTRTSDRRLQLGRDGEGGGGQEGGGSAGSFELRRVVCPAGAASSSVSVFSRPGEDPEARVIGALWRDDRVELLPPPPPPPPPSSQQGPAGVAGAGDTGAGGGAVVWAGVHHEWARIREDGRWSSSPTGEAWVVASELGPEPRTLAQLSSLGDGGHTGGGGGGGSGAAAEQPGSSSPAAAAAAAAATRAIVQAESGRRRHTVYARFSAFVALRQLLVSVLPQGESLPPLPPKTRLALHAGVGDAAFVEQRRAELECWLQALLRPPARDHAAAAGVAPRAPAARKMWGGPKGREGAAALATPYGLRFLGLLPVRRLGPTHANAAHANAAHARRHGPTRAFL